MGTTRMLVVSALLSAMAASASERSIKLIAEIPCLYEYRQWFFTSFRRSESFSVPLEYTAKQCAVAKQLHEEIEAGLHNEPLPEEIESQRHAHEEAAARDRQRTKDAAITKAAASKRQQEVDDRARQRREAAAKIASLPAPSVGMTAAQAYDGTRWGKPIGIRKLTTARGTSEQWAFYDRKYLLIENGVVSAVGESRGD